MHRPDLAKVPEFYHNYIHLVEEQQLHEALQKNTAVFVSFLNQLPAAKWDYRYAEGKWSIKEILQHLIDSERIFCYRALRISRNDEIPLAGFDQDKYVAESKAQKRNNNDMLQEFQAVRKATELMFASFDEEQLNATGIANENRISVQAIGFIIPGHVQHHLNVMQERYL